MQVVQFINGETIDEILDKTSKCGITFYFML